MIMIMKRETLTLKHAILTLQVGLACGQGHVASTRRKRIFDGIDTDHAGVISRQAFCAALNEELSISLQVRLTSFVCLGGKRGRGGGGMSAVSLVVF